MINLTRVDFLFPGDCLKKTVPAIVKGDKPSIIKRLDECLIHWFTLEKLDMTMILQVFFHFRLEGFIHIRQGESSRISWEKLSNSQEWNFRILDNIIKSARYDETIRAKDKPVFIRIDRLQYKIKSQERYLRPMRTETDGVLQLPSSNSKYALKRCR